MVQFFAHSPSTQPGLYLISGPDAADYLQRMSTVDIRMLKSNESTSGCLLTAQGRIRSFFTIQRKGPTQFWIEDYASPNPALPGLPELPELPELIDEFKFAENFDVSKLNLQSSTQNVWHCFWTFSSSGLTLPQEPLSTELWPELMIDHGSIFFGSRWHSIWCRDPINFETFWKFQKNIELDSKLTLDDLTKMRVNTMTPWTGHEITPDYNPLEIHLENSIASNKGCYPGQEVLEKIISIGAPSKRLCRIEFQNPLSTQLKLPVELFETPLDGTTKTMHPIGKLTTAIDRIGLAVIRRANAQCDGNVHLGPFENDPSGGFKLNLGKILEISS